jgi:asparagine synthase (glutamine-hydrolysing)
MVFFHFSKKIPIFAEKNIMNGLLATYCKKELQSAIFEEITTKGLNVMSHRGNVFSKTLLLDKDLKITEIPSDSVKFSVGTCSPENAGTNTVVDDDCILVFDGKILNKSDLYSLLSINSDSGKDAGLASLLFRKYGTACFKMIKGFWSIIVLDRKNGVIYAARDHFGNRPLFFCDTSNQFAVATESRALYTLFDDCRSINRNTVIDFLLWGDIGKFDQFFFNDIHSVEPSYYVKYTISTGKTSVEKYYTLPCNRSDDSYHKDSEKKCLDTIRHLLAESVYNNLKLYNEPVAIGVSGGMDSSSLLCTARQTNPDKTIVAYTTTDKYDGGEVKWAEIVVRHTGVDWIKVVCTSEDIVEKLAYANKIHNVPLYNASSLAQYRIMEEVKKQGLSIVIDGQGGDEMLGGYPAYFPLHLKVLRANGEWLSWWHELMSVKNSGLSVKEMLARRIKLIAKQIYYDNLKLALNARREEYNSLLPQTRDAYFKQPLPITTTKKQVLNDALYESYTKYLANILRWGEHSAAAFGIECVMPLSDSTDLAEYVFSIPSAYKIHDGWNKYLLRKSMVGLVPDEICWRKQKMGFYIPEQNWLNELGDVIIDTIRKSEDPEGCINKKYMMENWSRLYSPSNPIYQRFAFRCYSYLLWRNGL